MQILLKNANLFLPQPFGVGDILICEGKIKKIGKNIVFNCPIVDCKNKIITPMFVDGHEHLLGNHWDEDGLINAGVGTIVACLANEQNPKCVDKIIEIINRLKKEDGIDSYALAGSKDFLDSTDKFILNNSNVVGVKSALFQPQRPKPNLSYEKLKQDAITTYNAGLQTGKSVQLHLHLDHPFARGEKVNIEDINAGKLDNFFWIDKIVEETGVPYSIFKLTHCQKFYKKILEYANKGCFLDYTAFDGEYDNRFDDLVESIKNNAVDISKISISSDLGIMSMERGGSYETPITLLNTVKQLVLKKNLKFEQVLPFITTNALAPIIKTDNMLEENQNAKLVILNNNLTIENVVINDKIIDLNINKSIQN